MNLLQDHVRAGVFGPVQAAGIAARRGPQDSVAERVARYQARRDRVLEVVGPVRCEGTFLHLVRAAEGRDTDDTAHGAPSGRSAGRRLR